MTNRPLLELLKGHTPSRLPCWFMRQAGRYLPEYREMRGRAKSFLDFCYTPAMASEATLQPIRRFGMDGAIIFSDILVIPDALGVDVRFETGTGPVLKPIQTLSQLEGLVANPDKLLPVYEALRLTRKALPDETTLIGFAGAPWTLACYIIEGQGSRDFQKVRSAGVRDKIFFERLLGMLTKEVARHAIEQIKAGADCIQLFDSWSGVLSEAQFEQWVIRPTSEIVATIKAAYPEVPVIGFPRMAGSKFADYAKHTGVNAISFDSSVSLGWARDNLQPHITLQGNLDPIVLADDKDAMLAQAKHIIATLGDKAFIFNLGHGVLPHTPVENMQALCQLVKEHRFG
jgi:uroporphyrinogen decarboxylase